MTEELTNEQLRELIKRYTIRANTTTDSVARLVFQDWVAACKRALLERGQDS